MELPFPSLFLPQPEDLLVKACSEGKTKVVQELLHILRVHPDALTEAEKKTVPARRVRPLMAACSGGHLDVVRILLDAGANVELQSSKGATCLFVAVEKGRLEIVRELLKAKANVNAAKEDGSTPLWFAAANRRLEILRMLLDAGAVPDAPLHSAKGASTTALCFAAEKGFGDVVQLLLERGADCNWTKQDGTTPLYFASVHGRTEIIRLLLRHNANALVATNLGSTVLHAAASQGHLEALKLLLQETKVPINSQRNDKVTPLYIGACNGYVEVTKLLLDHGADPNVAKDEGATPLFIASQCGHFEVVKCLVAGGAKVDSARAMGATPLLIAAEKGKDQLVEFLAGLGADVNVVTGSNNTPLCQASRQGFLETVRILLKYGAAPNYQAKNNMTALHLATQMGHIRVVELLLQHGASTSIVQRDGNLPLHLAALTNRADLVELLLKYGSPSDIHVQNSGGNTPAMCASKQKPPSAATAMIRAAVANANLKILSKYEDQQLSGLDDILKLIPLDEALGEIPKQIVSSKISPIIYQILRGENRSLQAKAVGLLEFIPVNDLIFNEAHISLFKLLQSDSPEVQESALDAMSCLAFPNPILKTCFLDALPLIAMLIRAEAKPVRLRIAAIETIHNVTKDHNSIKVTALLVETLSAAMHSADKAVVKKACGVLGCVSHTSSDPEVAKLIYNSPAFEQSVNLLKHRSHSVVASCLGTIGHVFMNLTKDSISPGPLLKILFDLFMKKTCSDSVCFVLSQLVEHCLQQILDMGFFAQLNVLIQDTTSQRRERDQACSVIGRALGVADPKQVAKIVGEGSIKSLCVIITKDAYGSELCNDCGGVHFQFKEAGTTAVKSVKSILRTGHFTQEIIDEKLIPPLVEQTMNQEEDIPFSFKLEACGILALMLKEATRDQLVYLAEVGCIAALVQMPLKAMFERKIDDEIVLAALEALERTLQCGQKDWERNRFADYFTKAGALGLLERLRDTGRFKQKAGGILSQYLYVEKALEFRKKGSEQFASQNFATALKSFSVSLDCLPDTHPEKPAALCSRANCFFQLQRYDEAIADCNYALRLNPKFAKALYWRSSVFSALNKIKVAQQSAAVALALDPDDQSVRDLHKELQKLAVTNKNDCAFCGKASEKGKKNKKCGRCMKVYYCTTKHQQQDWTTHKMCCKETIPEQPRQDT